MTNYRRYTNKSSFTQKRKSLRGRNRTEAEYTLWHHLKAKQLGVKFRRQYNIGNYIVDFYCHELKLIIELDGWIHGEEKQRMYDEQRQAWLEAQSYHVLRYKNEHIKYEIESVLQDIWNYITTSKRTKDPS